MDWYRANIPPGDMIDAGLASEPNLQIARLPDVGHWTSMDQPEKANTAILEFLNTQETLP